MEVVPYNPLIHQALWDAFLEHSEAPHFIFSRRFLAYHAHRFTDASLIVQEGKQILAVLPAHINGTHLQSHGGLTFGGLIAKEGLSFKTRIAIWQHLLSFIHQEQIEELSCKLLPSIMNRQSAYDAYLLQALGANSSLADLNTFVDMSKPLNISQRRLRGIYKARKNCIEVHTGHHWNIFWPLLEQNLYERYRKSPVHRLDEIMYLAQVFPSNIQLFTAHSQGREIIAGVVVFFYKNVAHLQYIASNEAGRKTGAVDIIIAYLMEVYATEFNYLSLGISNTRQGAKINFGLLEWKAGWGAEALLHQYYTLRIETSFPRIAELIQL